LERRPVTVKRIDRLGVYSCAEGCGNATQSAPHIEDEHDMNGPEDEWLQYLFFRQNKYRGTCPISTALAASYLRWHSRIAREHAVCGANEGWFKRLTEWMRMSATDTAIRFEYSTAQDYQSSRRRCRVCACHAPERNDKLGERGRAVRTQRPEIVWFEI